MNIFGYEIGKKAEPKVDSSVGDVSINNVSDSSIFKAYVPEFLYKPPFGYPRKENLPLIRQLAKNPYVFSVIKTLADEAASNDYDIVYRADVEPTPMMDEKRIEMLKFFHNPNKNKESFKHLLRAVVKDIAELDSGVLVKVFNKQGEMTQLFARDGASFLKNPDIYGYMGNRAEYVEPSNINYAIAPEDPAYPETLKQYSMNYKEAAAYFQYGTTAMALPVPFGRREVIYISQNPRSDSIYGLSPIQILADVITTLVYGANYNLDFYMNNNMPEGVISILGANQDQLKAFRERFDAQFRQKDTVTGFMRKIGFKFPIVNQPVDFKPFQLDPKVMQIIEQQSWFTKLVWACFGVNADEMGFTEDSNRATGANQNAAYKRKAVRPMLELLKYHIENELIAEWGEEVFETFEFKWDDYDLEEDIKKHQLYESQIRMGIKTAEMIAAEEGINVEELKAGKAEEREQRMQEQQSQGFGGFGGNEEKNISGLKALGIIKGTRVKVVSPGAHGGKTGVVEQVRTNGEEPVYVVRFQDGMDIYFNQELKVVDGGIPDIQPEEPEEMEEEVEEKSMKFENDLEKELVTVIKQRGRELLKAMDQYKKGELDKIR